jgi:hypothetical protein
MMAVTTNEEPVHIVFKIEVSSCQKMELFTADPDDNETNFYLKGLDLENRQYMDFIHSHEDPMLPLSLFWNLYKSDMAPQWYEIGELIYKKLGYNTKEAKDKVNLIKYQYAVQGKEECAYQLLRFWQGEKQFWLFSLRTLVEILKTLEMKAFLQNIFDEPQMVFYTSYLEKDQYVEKRSKPLRNLSHDGFSFVLAEYEDLDPDYVAVRVSMDNEPLLPTNGDIEVENAEIEEDQDIIVQDSSASRIGNESTSEE